MRRRFSLVRACFFTSFSTTCPSTRLSRACRGCPSTRHRSRHWRSKSCRRSIRRPRQNASRLRWRHCRPQSFLDVRQNQIPQTPISRPSRCLPPRNRAAISVSWHIVLFQSHHPSRRITRKAQQKLHYVLKGGVCNRFDHSNQLAPCRGCHTSLS